MTGTKKIEIQALCLSSLLEPVILFITFFITAVFPERQYTQSGIPGRNKEVREIVCRILLASGVYAEILLVEMWHSH